jgi:hypothetical protein
MAKPISANIKASLVIIAVIIVVVLLWYSQSLVEKLQEREREIVRLYAKTIEYVANADPAASIDLTFLFTEVIQTIDFPIILSEPDNTPKPDSYRNIEVDSTLTQNEKISFLKNLVNEMDKVNPPIYIRYQNTIVEIVHYDESNLVKQLRWLPFYEILISTIFILIGYIGFSYIKRSEQSNIWVGMSKETAHQLGTPISSLIGWSELLKNNENLDAKSVEYIREMDNDLQRLMKVTARFSKIGSTPELKTQELADVIFRVIGYFEKRIPQMQKKVSIQFEKVEAGPFVADVNPELFEWVLENLVKNALDAFENGKGDIKIILSQNQKYLFIDVADNGKGIDPKYSKDVFRPGYSTKRRGWGLGLSLSKRIIEEYHKGKIFIKETQLGKGTTFRIRLKQ